MTDYAHGHRQLSLVTDQIIVSGDLSSDRNAAIRQIEQWRHAKVSHILDTRIEWTDETLVAEHAPHIVYGWFGTEDDGHTQSDEWFDDGVAFATNALGSQDAVLLVHCHMGINRGPSMAYRILLEYGWDPIEALEAIREARPMAEIGYADDALNHHHRRYNVSVNQRMLDNDRLEAWRRGYPTTGLRRLREPS